MTPTKQELTIVENEIQEIRNKISEHIKNMTSTERLRLKKIILNKLKKLD